MYNSMNGAPKGRKSIGQHYYASLMDDYPVAITTSKVAGKKLTDTSSGVLLAPVIVNQSDIIQARDVIKKLTGEA